MSMTSPVQMIINAMSAGFMVLPLFLFVHPNMIMPVRFGWRSSSLKHEVCRWNANSNNILVFLCFIFQYGIKILFSEGLSFMLLRICRK